MNTVMIWHLKRFEEGLYNYLYMTCCCHVIFDIIKEKKLHLRKKGDT